MTTHLSRMPSASGARGPANGLFAVLKSGSCKLWKREFVFGEASLACVEQKSGEFRAGVSGTTDPRRNRAACAISVESICRLIEID
jgi:hypothetical protein